MRIRVFLVEDSAVQAEVIKRSLSADGDIEVVGMAQSGLDCLERVPLLRPDVVVMDGSLPKLSGPDATARLLEVYPIPVILFTRSPEEYRQLAELSGAVATVSKNPDDGDPMSTLLRVVRLMNGMKVMRRRPAFTSAKGVEKKFLLIGSSSGGPIVVKQILEEVGPNSDLIVLLVQHLSQGGTLSFADWLSQVTKWPCHIATNSEIPKAGHVYLGPAGSQMRWKNGCINLVPSKSKYGFAPSVDELFGSFSEATAEEVIAIIISGMGSDGARGLLNLRLAGATTLAQDPTTAAVSGMPEAAIASGGVIQVVPTEKIGRVINSWIASSRRGK